MLRILNETIRQHLSSTFSLKCNAWWIYAPNTSTSIYECLAAIIIIYICYAWSCMYPVTQDMFPGHETWHRKCLSYLYQQKRTIKMLKLDIWHNTSDTCGNNLHNYYIYIYASPINDYCKLHWQVKKTEIKTIPLKSNCIQIPCSI